MKTNAKYQAFFHVARSDGGNDCSGGAARDKKATILLFFMLPFALALTYALVCCGNDQIVGLITKTNSRVISHGLFCALG